MPQPEPVTVEELLRFPLFEGESPEALAWIASHMEMRHYDAGETLANEGDPVSEFQLILDGEIHFGRAGDPNSHVALRVAGQVLGILPFSRMKTSMGRVWAAQPSRVAAMDAGHLRDLVYHAPTVAQRLVSEMTDRTRDSTRREEGSNRLLALGKLSAGLAHELNNPASAAVRSSARLREVLSERRRYSFALRAEVLPERARLLMAAVSDRITGCLHTPGSMDPLERSDKEDDLAEFLDSVDIPNELASGLVDAAISADDIRPVAELVPGKTIALGLRILVADHEIFCLTQELEEASRRISDLIQAVKSYSYMDQSPFAEVDVEQGLDATLRMFQHRLKQGIQLSREFARDLPLIRANGSELNQIWTNLVDNALDAMESLPPEQPRVLRVRTCAEPNGILVEVADRRC